MADIDWAFEARSNVDAVMARDLAAIRAANREAREYQKTIGDLGGRGGGGHGSDVTRQQNRANETWLSNEKRLWRESNAEQQRQTTQRLSDQRRSESAYGSWRAREHEKNLRDERRREEAHASWMAQEYKKTASFGPRYDPMRAGAHNPYRPSAHEMANAQWMAQGLPRQGRESKGSDWSGAITAAASSITAGIATARAVIDTAAALGHVTGSFLGKGIEQTSFKRGLMGQFTGLLGGQHQAGQFYQQIQGLSDVSPLDMQSIAPAARGILNVRGMDSAKTLKALTAMNDIVASTDTTPGDFRNINSFFMRGITGSTLGVQSYNRLAKFGVSKQNMIGGLAEERHISEDQASKLLSSKDLTTKENAFWDAFFAIAAKKDAQYGGGLGAAMEKFGRESVPAQLRTLGNRFDAMFQNINMEPLLGFLNELNDGLRNGTDMMSRFSGLVDNTFNDILGPWIGNSETNKARMNDLAHAADLAGSAIVGLSQMLETIVSTIPKMPNGKTDMREASGWIGDHLGIGGPARLLYDYNAGRWDASSNHGGYKAAPHYLERPPSEREVVVAKKNAAGGRVIGVTNGQAIVAAHGEGLASIGRGESIVPAGGHGGVVIHNEWNVNVTGTSKESAAAFLHELEPHINSIMHQAALQGGAQGAE